MFDFQTKNRNYVLNPSLHQLLNSPIHETKWHGGFFPEIGTNLSKNAVQSVHCHELGKIPEYVLFCTFLIKI